MANLDAIVDQGLATKRSEPSTIALTDVIIVGAGPAGLTAAIYLARYRRKVLVFTSERSRARWIPTSHNVPGFVEGIGGNAFLHRLEHQARDYGITIIGAEVTKISRRGRVFSAGYARGLVEAPFTVIATGVHDELPALAGAEEGIINGTLRICPVCDGYESRGQRIAVLGTGFHALNEAAFLKTYSDDVTCLFLATVKADLQSHCKNLGVAWKEVKIANLRLEKEGLSVAQPHSDPLHFPVTYAALGCHPQTDLIAGLKPNVDDRGALVVNAHQQTSIQGLYAAGDIVRGLNQIIVAAAEGAIAATNIHNRLG